MDRVFLDNEEPTYKPVARSGQENPDYGFLDALSAQLTFGNMSKGLIDEITAPKVNEEPEQGYWYSDYAKEKGIAPEEWEMFSNTVNPEQFDAVKADIDKRNQAREIVAESGGYGIAAGIVSATIDIPTLLTMGVGLGSIPAAKQVITAARSAMFGSEVAATTAARAVLASNLEGAVVSSAARLAGTGAAAETASEAVLQGIQPERTATESVANIASTTILSGIMGAGGQALANKLLSKSVDDMAFAMDKEMLDFSVVDDSAAAVTGFYGAGESSLSAAVVNPKLPLEASRTVAKGGKVMNKVFKTFEKGTAFLNPNTRFAASPLESIVSGAEQLLEFSTVRAKNVEGVASKQAVETALNQYAGRASKYYRVLDDEYSGYAKAAKSAGEKPLSKEDFRKQVFTSATVRDDSFTALPELARPFASRLAKAEDEAYGFAREQALSTGKWTEEDLPLSGRSYRPRSYVREKIVANPEKWDADITPWSLEKAAKAQEEAAATTKKFKSQYNVAFKKRDEGVLGSPTSAEYKKEMKFIKDFEEAEDILTLRVEELAAEIRAHVTAQVTSAGTDSGFKVSPMSRGPLKERTWDIDPANIIDFMETDPVVIMENTMRKAGAEIELTRSFGSARFEDYGKVVDEDYKLARGSLIKEKEAALAKDPSKADKIEKQYQKKFTELDKDWRDGKNQLADAWDLIRGTYRNTGILAPDQALARALSFERKWAYLSGMETAPLTAISDAGAMQLTLGYSKVWGESLKPLLKSFESPEFKAAISKNKQYLESLNIGVNTLTNARQGTLYGIGDPFIKGSMGEKMMHNLSTGLGNLGMNQWNDMMETIAGVTHQQLILKTALNGAKDPDTYVSLADAGLDKVMLGRINAAMELHGEVVGDLKVHVPNTASWTDKGAARALDLAISKLNGQVIIRKKAGDIPLSWNHPVGQVLTQFLSFPVSSNQKYLMRTLQGYDRNVATGVATMVSLGIGSKMLTDLVRNRVSTPAEDVTTWLFTGLDRSGMFSVPFMVNQRMLEPFGIGLRGNVTDKDAKQYFSPDRVVADAFGPSSRLARNQMKAAYGLGQYMSDGSMSASNAKALMSLVPFMDVEPLVRISNKMQESLTEE
jgi:hypothetical protein